MTVRRPTRVLVAGGGVAALGWLLGLHVVTPLTRARSLAVLMASVVNVYLGVELAHG